MSAIDEGIVREYFEQNGFFVRQARKYQVQARKKTGEEEIDLLVYNPTWQRGSRRPEFLLFASELPCIRRAIVAVKPWHTEVFSPGMLKSSHEIFGFLEKNVIKQVARMFPTEGLGETEDEGDITKILVLPALPTAEPSRSQSVQLLKERGVDAIISFRAMLLDLIEQVETNRSYGKSDTLQVIRLLKNYDLLKEPQMDLLTERTGAAPRRPKA
ncbi:MAG TPA: hypothetical protein VMC06_03290 [Opitutaceae bacterium]|nr:hypothetical protein [Opitutaceae bacterium]